MKKMNSEFVQWKEAESKLNAGGNEINEQKNKLDKLYKDTKGMDKGMKTMRENTWDMV